MPWAIFSPPAPKPERKMKPVIEPEDQKPIQKPTGKKSDKEDK
jgi:hypothetical protein